MNTYTYAHVLQQNFAMVQSMVQRTALAATEVGQTEEGSNSYHLSCCCCGGPWVRSQDKHTLTSEQKHRWIKDHCLMHHHIKGTMHCLFNCWTSSTGKSHNACIAQPHHPICCSVTSTLAESTPLHPATQTYNKSSLCKRHPNPQATCMHVCRGRVISRSVYNIVQHMSKDVGGLISPPWTFSMLQQLHDTQHSARRRISQSLKSSPNAPALTQGGDNVTD